MIYLIHYGFILCYIIWILYFLIEAFREAYYFHNASRITYKLKNLHIVFTYQRILVGLLINLLCIALGWKLILFNISLILIQPFMHNGMYYRTRNQLDNTVYKKGWFDMSTSSTSKFTKFETPNMRIVYAVISIIVLIFLLF